MPHYKNQHNEVYYLDNESDRHFLPSGCVNITDKEADDIRASKVVPLTYVDLRLAAYPRIGDQLDTMFHKGFDAWKSEIQAVKTKYPK
jgi:hypothetical protein